MNRNYNYNVETPEVSDLMKSQDRMEQMTAIQLDQTLNSSETSCETNLILDETREIKIYV